MDRWHCGIYSGDSHAFGPVPGRPSAQTCLGTVTTTAIRIEDEAPFVSPICNNLGGGSAPTYTKIDVDGSDEAGLRLQVRHAAKV